MFTLGSNTTSMFFNMRDGSFSDHSNRTQRGRREREKQQLITYVSNCLGKTINLPGRHGYDIFALKTTQ